MLREVCAAPCEPAPSLTDEELRHAAAARSSRGRPSAGAWGAFKLAVARWFDSGAGTAADDGAAERRVDWVRNVPFMAMHAACLGVVWVGWSPVAMMTAGALYLLRMLAITGFYHRYFSHRAFRTSRPVQFAFAVLGASAAQRGPLWWAAHHRHHHAHADRPGDPHSPRRDGFLWSHMGWFMSPAYFATNLRRVPDLARFPELWLLDRFDGVVPVLLGAALFGAGEWLASAAPALETDGMQMLVWGFLVSTVAVYHATYTINSLAHRFGRRRYATRDDSRNNFALALLTLGEGWHNNHHHYPGAARQGFRRWEIDVTWYFLCLLRALGLIWDLRTAPAHVLNSRRLAGPFDGSPGQS
ncbi:MAG: acyl-CoA desaturase [Gammaproteobacteria bacterium]|nr:acyl-CoA desaturase [Gammaproteobacteria bacterium]NIR84534.1 acyl-CoA desaturase [Gammaproteobacteria bacterium]NIR90437.1 acyl-CoA desaturase [Gammaproteobacteria bacterium]NIU05585.1 acyl-CoA desaturase [Gammaproteobacteria bacterium]NIV52724.1 acyl-CoA desaturase [Gammaproteobacteria bacterium]